jgi:hypothetical protein
MDDGNEECRTGVLESWSPGPAGCDRLDLGMPPRRCLHTGPSGLAPALHWQAGRGCHPKVIHMKALPGESIGGNSVPSVTEVKQPGLEINGLRGVLRPGSHGFLGDPKRRSTQNCRHGGVCTRPRRSTERRARDCTPYLGAAYHKCGGHRPPLHQKVGIPGRKANERREISRLFPPFPRLTAFGGKFFYENRSIGVVEWWGAGTEVFAHGQGAPQNGALGERRPTPKPFGETAFPLGHHGTREIRLRQAMA